MIILHDVHLCEECMIIAVNGDASGLNFSYPPDEAAARLATIEAGLTRLGPHLAANWDSETEEGIADFSWRPCDCCGSRLGGSRHRFAVLGDEPIACWSPGCYLAVSDRGTCEVHGPCPTSEVTNG